MANISKIAVGGTEYDIAGVGLIATIETTLTASKTYNVGDQFIYNGLLYKVTQTIASGTAITIGSNCQLAPVVADQLSAINSNLAKHDLGTPINVSPYENTPYTVPSDGYVWCEASGAIANAKIKIGSGVNTFEAIACGNTGRGGRATVFVRKDTVVTVSVEGGTLYQAWFYPLA